MLHRRLVTAVVAAALAAAALPAVAGASSSDTTIEVQDRCDPATFDAALGDPHACEPVSSSGGALTFGDFIARVTKDREAGGWRFSRDEVTIRSGQSLAVRLTRGGELHTFTEVPAYGNGCVELLNKLVFPGQDPTPPALCADAFPANRFPPTAVAPVRREIAVSNLAPGVHRFMCLIHPWMKTTVIVR